MSDAPGRSAAGGIARIRLLTWGFVQHLVVIVFVETEINANPVAEPEQKLQFRVVVALDAMLHAYRRPLQRARKVTTLSEYLRQNIARPRSDHILLGTHRGYQRVRLRVLVQVKEGTGQVDPWVGRRLPPILDGSSKVIHSTLRFPGHHPLITCPQVSLRAIANIGLLC